MQIQPVAKTQFELDRTGFPMIYAESLGIYVNFLPITKIQFEYFLCDRVAGRAFDEAWYLERLKGNGRCAPKDISYDNIVKAFMTGLIPKKDTEKFGSWLSGKAYHCNIPHVDAWKKIYEYFRDQPELDYQDVFSDVDGINPRALDLLKSLNSLRPSNASLGQLRTNANISEQSNRRLSDQMLLTGGVLEWVQDNNGWGAIGGSGPNANPLTQGLQQINQHETRPPHVGFRFLIQGK